MAGAHSVMIFDWPSFTQASLANRLRKPGDGRQTLQRFLRFGYNIFGNKNASLRVSVGTGTTARATNTATVVQASLVDATSTFVTMGVTLTAKTTPITSAQFGIGTTNTEAGTNLKNAINAHATLSKYMIATSVLGVVTVTMLLPGSAMNFIAVTGAGGGITIGTANFAGGTGLDFATVDSFVW